MSKKKKFIDYIEQNYFSKINLEDIDPEVISYWNAFKVIKDEEKPILTDNGKLILKVLQEKKDEMPSAKAKDIAEELFISARVVSGSMRKLVSDGFVEKLGQDPIIYSLTEKGINFTDF